MSLASLFVKVGADTQNFKSGMQNVRNDLDRTAHHASMWSNAMSTAIGVGLANAVSKSVGGLVNLGKSIVSTGIEFNNLSQNASIAFETMLGSADQAQTFMGDLKRFAKATPFELPGLTETSQRLLAFGFSAKSIVPMLTNIGDATAALGGSPEKMNRIVVALGQIKAKGRVLASEMLQLTEAGIPAWDMLAKKIGVSIPEAMKLGEKGLIDSDTAITAILEGMNAKFGGLMSRQAKSWSGMLSNIKDTFTQVSGRVMKPFFDLGSKGMEKLLQLFETPMFESFVQAVEKSMTKLAGYTEKVFVFLTSEGLRNTLKKLSSVLSGLGTTLIKLVRPFKESLGSLFLQLSTMRNMGFSDVFKAVISSIVKAFSGLAQVIKNEFWPSIKEGIQWVWSTLKDFSTTIEWGFLWDNLITGVKTLVTWVGSIDWYKVWSVIWENLKSLGTWFKDNVMPSLGDFFSWLLSWFTESSKRQQLWNAVATSWDFITTWAKAFIEWVSPHLANFWSWLTNWFTDSSKRQQLWDGVVVTWNWITEWAKALIEWVTPYLNNFWDWLSSWITDPTKRQKIWDGVVAAWNWATEWAKALVSWVTPYLVAFWKWLTSWFTDPSKKQQLWEGVKASWTAVTEWGKALWGWLLPHLTGLWVSLKTWIDTNHPSLGKWIDEFVNAATKIKDDWMAKWPIVTQAFIEFATTVKTEIPLIVKALADLFSKLTGADLEADGIGGYLAKATASFTRYFGALIKTARLALEVLNEMVDATKAVFNFDWNGYVSNSLEFGNKITELWNHLSTFSQLGQGYASGGNVAKTGSYLVGESGPEIVNLPMGSRVWDHGQTTGKLQGSSSKLDVFIHNNSKFPIDRQTVKEIATALQRELNLQGNRVVFST